MKSVPLLDNIKSPTDLKRLNIEQQKQLATEIRAFLIEMLSKSGGHLASNLGVVELTLALHTVFNTPEDKLIWDVGHQAYVHKIITGRKNAFKTLRKLGGISGFPKTSESVHDAFNTGHSSTSISAALGFARARDIKGENNNVVAIIGDGALTGGMAFEALNDAGHSNTNLIVILNDNQMSISENVGSMSNYLNRLRTMSLYNKFKNAVEGGINMLPFIGKNLSNKVKLAKDAIKYLLLPGTLFGELGFLYIGPIDGHDLNSLVYILRRVKRMRGPVLVHVRTDKGKGYAPAEKEPHLYHGISRFDIDTGDLKPSVPDYSSIFGKCLTKLATVNLKIVAVTAAMPIGTGLVDFAKKYPQRFFDVGIAESHAVTMVAGMAQEGLTPVIAVYSSFLQRAYDQILHDVALQNLHVVFAIDRAGVVGEDGETHQGIYDLSFLSHIPNMTILCPSNFNELEKMLEYATMQYDAPIAIRYPRGGESKTVVEHTTAFKLGKGELISSGENVTIAALGRMVAIAIDTAELLEKSGISCDVIDLRSLKPLDEDIICQSAKKTGLLVTVEDNVCKGGLGEAVASILLNNGLCNVKHILKAYPDKPIQHGSVGELMSIYSLDSQSIANSILKELNRLEQ